MSTPTSRYPRLYDTILDQHLNENRQMAFLVGPRQVGKTTLSTRGDFSDHRYFNWDNADHRRSILAGQEAIAQRAGLDRLTDQLPVIAFDELHKFKGWKDFLKGFFDTYGQRCKILVTGSARLDVFKRGGDSLMGRYFLYHVHPFSVAELAQRSRPTEDNGFHAEPAPIEDNAWNTLQKFGGFPEVLFRASPSFYRRWRGLRSHQLFDEDMRDLTRIQDIDQMQVLSQLIVEEAGQLLNYSRLANQIRVSVDTIRRWLATLEALYFCFRVRPYSRNVARSLRKEPKAYPWDWSLVKTPGARAECMVANHLLKAAHAWTDLGIGDFELHYVRDKDQREVDFLLTRDDEPYLLLEVKSSDSGRVSPSLKHFQKQLRAPHALQLVLDLPYVHRSCFDRREPLIAPARTLLSQLA